MMSGRPKQPKYARNRVFMVLKNANNGGERDTFYTYMKKCRM